MVAHHRSLAVICLALAVLLWPASHAPASVTPGALEIQISGLPFKYDQDQGGSLFDAWSIDGGNGLIGEATGVNRIDFFLEGTLSGSLLYDEGLYVDFLIDGIYDIPSVGGVVNGVSNGPGFGFDLLSTDRGRFLALDLDMATVTYVRNAMGPFLQLSFVALGPSAGVVSQDLPFDLVLDEGQPITVRVSTLNLTNPVEEGGHLTGFSSQGGVANVFGHVVPEPQSFAFLLGLGVLVFELNQWKRRRRIRRRSAYN